MQLCLHSARKIISTCFVGPSAAPPPSETPLAPHIGSAGGGAALNFAYPARMLAPSTFWMPRADEAGEVAYLLPRSQPKQTPVTFYKHRNFPTRKYEAFEKDMDFWLGLQYPHVPPPQCARRSDFGREKPAREPTPYRIRNPSSLSEMGSEPISTALLPRFGKRLTLRPHLRTGTRA